MDLNTSQRLTALEERFLRQSWAIVALALALLGLIGLLWARVENPDRLLLVNDKGNVTEAEPGLLRVASPYGELRFEAATRSMAILDENGQVRATLAGHAKGGELVLTSGTQEGGGSILATPEGLQLRTAAGTCPLRCGAATAPVRPPGPAAP